MSPLNSDFHDARHRIPSGRGKRLIAVLLTPLLLMLASASVAAQEVIGADQQPYNTVIAKEHFMKPTAVYRIDASPTAGYLMNIDRDSLYLQSRGVQSGVAFSEILRVTLPGHTVSDAFGIHGGVIGAYILNRLTWQVESHPGAYAEIHGNELSPFILGTIGYGLLVGGVAYLIGTSTDSDEENFLFAAADPYRREEIDRFRRTVTGQRDEATVHFTVQLSIVHPGESERAARILREGSLTPDPIGYNYYGYKNSPSSLNLFRKLQATITVKPGFAVGAAFMNLAEPTYKEEAVATRAEFKHQLFISTNALGYYAVAAYEPLHEKWKGPIDWLIGGGLGAVRSGGEIIGSISRRISPYDAVYRREQSLDGSRFSAMLFSDLRWRLYPSLSLSLSAEYVTVSAIAVDAIGGISPSSSIDLSSWSWGFSVGLHF